MKQVPTGIIMPAHNASGTIGSTIARIPVNDLAEQGVLLTLYIVDDGSDDDTAGEALRATERSPVAARLMTHHFNRGYGAAQKTGLNSSLRDGNHCHVILHSDGQYAPEELATVLKPLLAGDADVVIGSKFMKGDVLAQGMPLTRMLGIRWLDWIENLVFNLADLEFHSGYMAYTSEAVNRIGFFRLTDRFHFDGQMVLTAAKAGLRITRVPISTSYTDSSSSLDPWLYLAEIVDTIWSYYRGGFRAE